ncbi:NAD(P)/FAD-dependent oxidoreductase [Mogibacterium diversum]
MKQSTRLKNIDRTNNHDISAKDKGVQFFAPEAANTSSVISTNVLIVGAGASGLMCAANLKTGGLILEGSSRVGTKLLMSGHGHCNITHAGNIKDFPSCYGDSGRLIRKILYKYSNADLVSFLNSRGIKTVTQADGRVFPESMRAQDVRDAFLSASEQNGFKVITNRKVVEIRPYDKEPLNDKTEERETRKFILVAEAPDGQRFYYEAQHLVIATGGKSYPKSGSDGSMLDVISRGLGLEYTEQRPSLSPLSVKDYPYEMLAGVSFDEVEISIYPKEGKRRALLNGSMLLAHDNFTGPAILNSSKCAEPGYWLQINYVGMSRDEVLARLISATGTELKSSHGRCSGARIAQSGELGAIIAKEFALPRRFAKEVAKRSACSAKKAAVLLTEDRFEIESRGDFSKAIVTAGGLRLDQFDCKSMQLKSAPNVYCIGEILDVDGITGGYNLQFAWSSARAAAASIEANINNSAPRCAED